MDKLWKTCAEFYANTVMESQHTAALWPCGHATAVPGAVTVQQDSIDPWITCLWVLPFGPREERARFPFQGFPGLLMCRSHAYPFGELVLEHHAAGADHWRTAAPALSGNENLKTDAAFTHPTARPISRGESQGWTGSPQRWANCPTALQPYYTMMDILQKIGPAGANGELQTDRNTKAPAPCPLLSQVCYLLDRRFARRYVCVVFVAEAYYEETLARWHGAFSSRMRTTLMLVQALQRAVGDKTTVARHSWACQVLWQHCLRSTLLFRCRGRPAF